LNAGGERLPIRDNSVDVALVNGIFNLNPARVLRSSGWIFAAEIILRERLLESERTTANWFA